MKFEADAFYHVYNRGNQHQTLFFDTKNYHYFLRKIRKELKAYCDIVAYCLMPNHYHLLIKAKDHDFRDRDMPSSDQVVLSQKMHPLARKIGTLQSSYTRAIHKQKDTTGSLFQQKAKAIHLESVHHLFSCFHYIHQNPCRAKLVKRMEEWPFSSYLDYCQVREGSLPAKAIAYEYLEIPDDPKIFIAQSLEVIPDDVVDAFF